MTTIIPAVTMALLAACAAPERPPNRVASNASERGETQQKNLFLHVLSPGANGARSHRVASTRVYLSRDFSVSVGPADNPFTNRWDGAVTLPFFNTSGVAEKRPLESLWHSGDAVLAGRVYEDQGKLFAHLQARNHNTVNYFRGEIELEKPVEQHGSWFQGAAVFGVWFVLSENPDCSQFLRALDNGTLRSPAIVAPNSPEAKRWIELDSGKSARADEEKAEIP